MMKKVVVTGANGFVGAAVCKELSDHGIKVIAVIHQTDDRIREMNNDNRMQIISCELSEYKNLDKKITDRDIDAFFHFAWEGSAGTLRGNDKVQISNIEYTCDTVRACKELGCKRLIFASSIMEYEIGAVMETETTPGINTLYCSAKVAADYMARTIAGSLDIEFIRAVISNVYGPGEKSPRLVNTSIRKMLKGERCSFSAGEQLYDFIYITDAAKAFAAIGEKGVANRAYYIGSLEPRPLKEFLIQMRDCVDPTVEIGLGDIPFNGISLSYKEFDVQAVMKDTGFIPSVSFVEGICNTIQWIKEVD